MTYGIPIRPGSEIPSGFARKHQKITLAQANRPNVSGLFLR